MDRRRLFGGPLAGMSIYTPANTRSFHSVPSGPASQSTPSSTLRFSGCLSPARSSCAATSAASAGCVSPAATTCATPTTTPARNVGRRRRLQCRFRCHVEQVCVDGCPPSLSVRSLARSLTSPWRGGAHYGFRPARDERFGLTTSSIQSSKSCLFLRITTTSAFSVRVVSESSKLRFWPCFSVVSPCCGPCLPTTRQDGRFAPCTAQGYGVTSLFRRWRHLNGFTQENPSSTLGRFPCAPSGPAFRSTRFSTPRFSGSSSSVASPCDDTSDASAASVCPADTTCEATSPPAAPNAAGGAR